MQQQRFEIRSPYPPPAIIEALERNCPGASDRLLAMVEQNCDHQRKMQADDQSQYYQVVERNQKNEAGTTRRGQITATVMVGMFCIVGLGFAWMDYPWLGMLAFGIGAAGLIGITIWGRYQQVNVGNKIMTHDESERPENQDG